MISERAFFPTGDNVPLEEATMLLNVMGTAGHT